MRKRLRQCRTRLAQWQNARATAKSQADRDNANGDNRDGKPVDLKALNKRLKRFRALQKKARKLQRGLVTQTTSGPQTTWYVPRAATCPKTVSKAVLRFLPYVGVGKKGRVQLRLKLLRCGTSAMAFTGWTLQANTLIQQGRLAPTQRSEQQRQSVYWNEADLPISPRSHPAAISRLALLRRLARAEKRTLALSDAKNEESFAIADTRTLQQILDLFAVHKELSAFPQSFR